MKAMQRLLQVITSGFWTKQAEPVKKGRGRPKGSTNKPKDTAPVADAPKRGRGRPKKEAPVADATVPKRGPGRPKKVTPVADATVPKRGPGRPKKVVEVAPVADAPVSTGTEIPNTKF